MAIDLERPQSFANHRAIAGVYIAAGLVLAADVVVRIVQSVRDPQLATVWTAVAGAALLVVWQVARGKALIVQDRVIRLETRLRLERVLPPEQRADVARLTLDQLLALRFASDAELPALVRDVLAQGMTDRDEIKRRVKSWQAAWLRV